MSHDLIGELDLALAALRRVIVRAIDAKPRPAPAAPMSAPPKPAAPTREIPDTLLRVAATGIEINLVSSTVCFGGKQAIVRGYGLRMHAGEHQ